MTITNHGFGILSFVDGDMNSQKYSNVLDEYLWYVIVEYFGNSHWHFMDDHRSRQTEEQYTTIFWPPTIPDLNVWLVLKNHLKALKMSIFLHPNQ